MKGYGLKDDKEHHIDPTYEERVFKPLPSDLIQDPGVWVEWMLDSEMRVVKKEGK